MFHIEANGGAELVICKNSFKIKICKCRERKFRTVQMFARDMLVYIKYERYLRHPSYGYT